MVWSTWSAIRLTCPEWWIRPLSGLELLNTNQYGFGGPANASALHGCTGKSQEKGAAFANFGREQFQASVHALRQPAAEIEAEATALALADEVVGTALRSEERRVGKEC